MRVSLLTRTIRSSRRGAKRPRARSPRARRRARGRGETPARPGTARVVPRRRKGEGRALADADPKEMAHGLLAESMGESAAVTGLRVGITGESAAATGLRAESMGESAVVTDLRVGITGESAAATGLRVGIPEARGVPDRTGPRAAGRVEISGRVTRTRALRRPGAKAATAGVATTENIIAPMPSRGTRRPPIWNSSSSPPVRWALN